MVSKSSPPDTFKAVILLHGQSSQESRGSAIAVQRLMGEEIGIRSRSKLLGKHHRPVLRYLFGEAALELSSSQRPNVSTGATKASLSQLLTPGSAGRHKAHFVYVRILLLVVHF